jgi:FeS assembly protein IscX
MKWTDTQEIAEKLFDLNPELDPKGIRFTDLFKWIIELEGFDDDHSKCGERILEAIQLAWIDEYE